MTAKLASVDDQTLAGGEAAGAMGSGSIAPRRASDEPQGGFMQFGSGYPLAPLRHRSPQYTLTRCRASQNCRRTHGLG
jgi:hypothetical protein